MLLEYNISRQQLFGINWHRYHIHFPNSFALWQQVESTNEVISVYSLDAEFSKPLWVFGLNSYEFLESHEQKNLIACSYR